MAGVAWRRRGERWRQQIAMDQVIGGWWWHGGKMATSGDVGAQQQHGLCSAPLLSIFSPSNSIMKRATIRQEKAEKREKKRRMWHNSVSISRRAALHHYRRQVNGAASGVVRWRRRKRVANSRSAHRRASSNSKTIDAHRGVAIRCICLGNSAGGDASVTRRVEKSE